MSVITGSVPPGTLTYREHSTTNGDQLTRDQMRHIHAKTTDFGKKVGDTPASGEYLLHVAVTDGFVRSFSCGNLESGSSASMTFDLKKYATGGNSGSSILSAAVTVTSSDTDNTPKPGTINTVAYNAGDRFYALLTVSSATGALSPEALAVFDETSP